MSCTDNNNSKKKLRNSNLELYRIISMMMIVAHHFVVNSGLTREGGPLLTDYTSGSSLFLTVFGAWGKTGINCFLMITGYYMCLKKITLRKFIKLMGQVYFYRIIIYLVFLIAGYESISVWRIFQLAMPDWGFTGNNFVSCFIVFWLTIPFLSILVHNMSKRQHELLLLLLLGCYTLLGSVPTFNITFNYITWFGVLFFIASYIRLYPNKFFNNTQLWRYMTLLCVALGVASILGLRLFSGSGISSAYHFVSDSNKLFAVSIAFCSFLWFKNMNIKYSKVINALGAGTFGVLLIHANSDVMRSWLWKDTVDVVSHYTLPFSALVLFSVGVVITIFIVCNLIDQIRIATIEKWFFYWYYSKVSAKVNSLVNKILL